MSWIKLFKDWAVNYWISKGFPKEKIILGLALYGRGFKLTDMSAGKPGSPSRGPSAAGNFTSEAGVLSYFEVYSHLCNSILEIS